VPTHQSLGGASDEQLLQRMVSTHSERYGPDYWAAFDAFVAPHLPARPVVIDLGCGPGLFLHDLARRVPSAHLYGYDVTPAMIAYGQGLKWPGATPTLAVHDVTAAPLPHAAGAVDLVSMTSVLHVVDEPLPVLAEIRRVLTPRGIFLLHDWTRQPFQSYLAWRRERMGETGPEHLGRAFRLFPVHNKYTGEDWQWLLAEAGFAIRHQAALRQSHLMFVATAAAAR
jgi:SAM-dependent methyltransferase